MNDDILLCPVCETENDALRQTCLNCGQSLISVCPRCNTVNAITAEQCFACGQQFDALGQIMARHEVRFADRFTRQATTAIEITAAQKESDRARSQQMWEVERQRQELLANQLVRRKAQERQLMIGATIAVIVVVAIVVLIALTR